MCLCNVRLSTTVFRRTLQIIHIKICPTSQVNLFLFVFVVLLKYNKCWRSSGINSAALNWPWLLWEYVAGIIALSNVLNALANEEEKIYIQRKHDGTDELKFTSLIEVMQS